MAAIAVTLTKTNVNAVAPTANSDSVTWRLYACLPSSRVVLAPGQSAVVGTGCALAYDAGFMGVLSAAGTDGFEIASPILSTGGASEIIVTVFNPTSQTAIICHGAPLANLWFVPIQTGVIT